MDDSDARPSDRSHEGGPETTQQRTVAELLAMYGGEDSAAKTPQRRRRRPDEFDPAPQTIIERINSGGTKFDPIREDQPPPARRARRAQNKEIVDDDGEYLTPAPVGGVDTAAQIGMVSVSIYLHDGASHEAVEVAVTRALELAGAPIV